LVIFVFTIYVAVQPALAIQGKFQNEIYSL